jgi:hypothetical protein
MVYWYIQISCNGTSDQCLQNLVIAIIFLFGVLCSITVLSSRLIQGPGAMFLGPMAFLTFYLGSPDRIAFNQLVKLNSNWQLPSR